MSEGITLLSPCCHSHYAKQKEYDKLEVKLREHSLKHPNDVVWYVSSLPVYTCQKCGKQWVIERVNQ